MDLEEIRNEYRIKFQNVKTGDVFTVKYEQYGYVHYFHTGFDYGDCGETVMGEGMTDKDALQMFLNNLESFYESGP